MDRVIEGLSPTEGVDEVLPDIQAERPAFEIALPYVGVSNLKLPVMVAVGEATLMLIVTVDVFVGLPSNQRGVHMSRLVDGVIQGLNGVVELDDFDMIVDRIVNKVIEKNEKKEIKDVADRRYNVFVKLETEIFLDGQVIKVMVMKDSLAGKKVLGVEVEGGLACPCGMAMTGSITHSQRGKLTIKVQPNGHHGKTLNTLIDIAKSSFSEPVWMFLKRPQEKTVIEKMHSNPKFVEDVVRFCVAALKEKRQFVWAEICCVAMESIHPYNAVAKWIGYL